MLDLFDIDHVIAKGVKMSSFLRLLLIQTIACLFISCQAEQDDEPTTGPQFISQEVTLPLTSRLPLSGEISPDGQFFAMDYVDDYIAVARGSLGLSIISLANREAPVHVAELDLGSDLRKMTHLGRTLYLWSNDQALQIVDLSEPSRPKELPGLAWEQVADFANDLQVYAGKPSSLYMATLNRGVLNFALQGSAVPQPVSLNAPGLRSFGSQIQIVNKQLFISEEMKGLSVYSINSQEVLRPLGRYTLPERKNIEKFVVRGEWLYASVNSADGDGSLDIIHVGDPARPKLFGSTVSLNRVLDFVVLERHILALVNISPSRYGLQLINVEDPSAPLLTTRNEYEGQAARIGQFEHLIHVFVEGKGLVQMTLAEGL